MEKSLSSLDDVVEKKIDYKCCEKYKGSEKRVLNFCKSIGIHTKKYKDYYKNYVNSLLEPYRSTLKEKDKVKYLPILEIISKHKPNLSQKIEEFKNDLNNISYVMDDKGDWHPVNKLNTNYSDLSELLTHMFEKFFTGKPTDLFFEKILDRETAYNSLKEYTGTNTFILSLKNQVENNRHLSIDQVLALASTIDIINHNLFIKEGLENVLSKKVKLSIDEIKDFINNTTKNSYEGEVVENNVEMMLNDYGWKTIHKGGNGDFIDMKFGIDLIVEKDGVYKFVQVKKVWDIKFVPETIMRTKEDGGAYMVSGKVSDIRDDSVDLLGLGTMNGKCIVTERQNDVVELKESVNGVKYQYTDKKVFPGPKSGFAYVDKAFDNMQNVI